MNTLNRLGYRKKLVSCDVVIRKSARRDFWLRERRHDLQYRNTVKRVLLLTLLFFFLLGAWMNSEWLYYRRMILWGVLIGSFAQIPIIAYIFRGNRER